ncbi:putative manganese-dependent protein phosphatase [Streptomyces sp. NBRC 110611]|uniref:ATP-binding SpoIIE family protein phosphatase n=1 Tax=Streptomyces sp. NBRC 110611 TaxID=1621259 RepID=UPI000858A892|nr:ATP-binding SpoIIE family protein phosphatase [Streptomyces sp. NBRC 110611]GAU69980.1 putative manganese-dependent protein phosphatase [Streptomyces sp. NBRC 110611]
MARATTPDGSGDSGDSGGLNGPGGHGGADGCVPGARTRRVRLPGNPQAAAAARRFVRESFAHWAAQRLPGAEGLTDRLADEALLLVSELVTNAVVHAGTTVELRCRLAPADGPDDGADPDPDPGPALEPDRCSSPVPGSSPVPAPNPGPSPGPAPGPSPGPGPGPDSLPGVVIEVCDRHPARPVRARAEGAAADGPASESGGRGLQLISAVAESWGITYRRAMKAVWFRLPLDVPGAGARPEPELPYDDQIEIVHGDPLERTSDGRLLQRELRAAELLAPVPRRPSRPEPGAGRVDNGALSFLAEASDLLSGQLDADQVAALAAQLIVPRIADWCAVWLHDGDGDGGGGGSGPGRGPGAADGQGEQRLARVWHTCESRIDSLRAALEKQPPELPDDAAPGSAPVAVPWPWPHEPGCDDLGCADPGGEHLACGDLGGAALACPLSVGGRRLGTLLLGRGGLARFPDEVVGLIEDLGRRVARALATARAYRRQERISQVLQRRLLPRGRARVPGVESAVVYEPREGAWAGGDFWDLFDAGNGRWCFALGDVCGSGPEAAAVTGLARPVLRMLARDGFGVAEVLDRLNKTMAREAADSVAAVAAAVAAAGAGAEAPVEVREEGEQARFLSLLYGEIVPFPGGSGGARCTLASAGHPLPLVLGTDGAVRVVAAPQVLLGVVEDAAYVSESFELRPGETLLCVTDGVTERRSGRRLFDDEDGLAKALAAGVGLTAKALADHLRAAVHAFDPAPPDDDLALLVLKAAGGSS